MKFRAARIAIVCLMALVVWLYGFGCRTRMVYPQVDVDVSKLLPDIYVETEPVNGTVQVISNEDEAIQRALERHPDVVALRGEVRVAWAQARTISGLRDPELGVAFGRGDRITERSWLVPRAELMPRLVHPSRGWFVTSHPEDVALSTDARVPRIVIPEGGEQAYLERSPRTFRGTTSDSDMFRTSIRFYPPNPFIITAHGAMTRAQYAATVCDLYFLEWAVRCRVRWLLARLRYLEEDISHLTEVVALRKGIAEAADELSQQGQALALDAVAAAQQYLDAVADRDRMLMEQGVLRRELERLVGGTVNFPKGYGSSICDVEVGKIQHADWRKLIIERRRDIGAAYWRAQAADAALREAQMTRIPWFTRIEGSVSRTRQQDRMAPAWELQRGTAELDPLYSISLDETEESEWRVEAMVTIPFFSLGPGATRVQATDRKRAWTQLASTTRNALDGVRDAIQTWQEAEQRLQNTRVLLAPRLAQTRSVLEALRAGQGTAGCDQDRLRLAVLDMLRLAAQREFEVAEAQLRTEEALGMPLVEALEQLSQEQTHSTLSQAQTDQAHDVQGARRGGIQHKKPKKPSHH